MGCTPAVAPAPPSDVVVAVPVGVEDQALRGALKVYEASSGLKVRVETLSLDLYADRVANYLLAGRGDYDLIYLPVEQLPRWAAYHAIQPLTLDESARESLAPWLSQVSIQGERNSPSTLMGIPTQPSLEVLWYRTDWLQDAGLQPPATWEAFQSAARLLENPPERWGVAVAAGPDGAGYDFAPYLAGFCAPSLTWDCDQDRQRAALMFYLDLARNTPWEDLGRAGLVSALREGQAAMAILPLSYASALLDCAHESPVCDSGSSLLSWAPVPGLQKEGTGSLGVWIVPLHASHSQAGKDLVAWLASREGATAWTLSGGLPAYRGITDDVQVGEKYPYLVLLDNLEQYQPGLPLTTGSGALWSSYHAAIHQAVGAADPGAVFDAFELQVQLALRRDGNGQE